MKTNVFRTGSLQLFPALFSPSSPASSLGTVTVAERVAREGRWEESGNEETGDKPKIGLGPRDKTASRQDPENPKIELIDD